MDSLSSRWHCADAFRGCIDVSVPRDLRRPRHTLPDDVVHIYAVEYHVEVCELVASVLRQDGQAIFNLPDLSDEAGNNTPVTFHLYSIVEAANTACIPTLTPYEKRLNKDHRNPDRRVSPSIYIGRIKAS